MTILDKLTEFIEHDFDSNYWSDDAVLYAMELVKSLTTSEWATLYKTWSNFKPGWQQRLADSLSEGPEEQALPILKQMLLSSHDDVSMQAAESIRSMHQAGFTVNLNTIEVGRLKQLSKMGRLNEMVLANLIKRFDV